LVPGLAAKIVLLAIVVALAVFAIPALIDQHEWIGVAIVLAAAVLLVVIYASPRRAPLKYLIPGTLLLLAFQLYPVIYTVSSAFTNYGDGHLLTKSQAISAIEKDSVQEVPGTQRYELSVATTGDPASAPFVYFLTAPDGTVYQGTSKGLTAVPAGEVRKA
jgi:arabinogalactan oligomer/maltooligosaccharide transport system permease protein